MFLLRWLCPFITVFTFLAGLSSSSAANEADWFNESNVWTGEIQFSSEFLGHLGSSSLPNTPSTGFLFGGQAGLWYAHRVQAYLHLTHSISGDGVLGLGGGLRVSLFELGGRSTGGNFSWNRGLLSFGPNSLLLHLDLEGARYSFSPLDPAATYPRTQSGFLYGGGVQWAPRIQPFGVTRIYIDTAFLIIRLGGVLYGRPSASLGIDL